MHNLYFQDLHLAFDKSWTTETWQRHSSCLSCVVYVDSVPCYCVMLTFTDSSLPLSFVRSSPLLILSTHIQVDMHTLLPHGASALVILTTIHSQILDKLARLHFSVLFTCPCSPPLFDNDSGIMGFVHCQKFLSSIKHLGCFILRSHWCQTAELFI